MTYVIVHEPEGYPGAAETYHVLVAETGEQISHHESRGEAIAACNRYAEADERRNKEG